MKYRLEHDSMGEVQVPVDALYGAQTQRAVDNSSFAARPMPALFIHSLALIKSAAARANAACGSLERQPAKAIEQVAAQVAAGEHDAQFPVGVFQTGSGTSTNMNMNEVLARLATQHCGKPVHPNDHVNCSQSSNDVIPACIQVSATAALEQQLLPAMQRLSAALEQRSTELAAAVKTGRTHLMDAMPVTFGQELATWAFQLGECAQRLADLQPRLRSLPIGGSAVGTGVNVPAGFAEALAGRLSELLASQFTVSPNPASRMAGQEVAVECSACLRSLAHVLSKINNDLRWMSSGPLAGLAEIQLEALQPGSSIMPGKVNPVLPEAALMAAAEVVGNDATIAMAARSGNFQLNVMLPLIADKVLASIELMSGACTATARAVAGFTVNHEKVEQALARNPMLVTALNTRIGYEAAAAIARRAYAEQRPIIDVAAQDTGIPVQELAVMLDPARLAGLQPDS
jgi:fumarate hydratase class II